MPTHITPHGHQRICPYCKHYVKANATVCPSCGRRLDGNWFMNLPLTTKVIVVIVALIALKIIFN